MVGVSSGLQLARSNTCSLEVQQSDDKPHVTPRYSNSEIELS